jgi:hypothetical protein
VAHSDRKVVGKLDVVSRRRGAHWGGTNRSPEFLLPSGTLGCCRERGYKARRCITEGALDTYEEGEYDSVN